MDEGKMRNENDLKVVEYGGVDWNRVKIEFLFVLIGVLIIVFVGLLTWLNVWAVNRWGEIALVPLLIFMLVCAGRLFYMLFMDRYEIKGKG